MSVLEITDGQRIKNRRKSLGLTQKELAVLIGLGDVGERTIRGWENGEHIPSKASLDAITSLGDAIPFRMSAASKRNAAFSFIDLFAGIGGLRLPFQEQGGLCVFTSEWDKFSQKTYAANFGEKPQGDITKISASDIPQHDVLLAGFPCQAFSSAGKKLGFEDTRVNTYPIEKLKNYLGYIENLCVQKNIPLTGINIISAAYPDKKSNSKEAGYQTLIFMPTTTIDGEDFVTFDPLKSTKGSPVTFKSILAKKGYKWLYDNSKVSKNKNGMFLKNLSGDDDSSGSNKLGSIPPM